MSLAYIEAQVKATIQHLVYGPPRPSWDRQFTARVYFLQSFLGSSHNSSSSTSEYISNFTTPVPPNISLDPYEIKVTPTQLPGVFESISQKEDGTRIISGEWLSPVQSASTHAKGALNSQVTGKTTNFEKNNNKFNKIILYLHGGSYMRMSTKTHRGITSNVATHTGYPVIAIDYRLAPSNPFPTGLFDAVYTYLHLIDKENGLGYDPKDIVIAGDSAGGGLSLALCCYLRDHKYGIPCAIVAISPWVDPMASDLQSNEHDYIKLDPHNNPIQHYIGEYSVQHPYITLIDGNLDNLPPILLQYGEVETIRGQIERFSSKYEKQNPNALVRSEMYEDMIHVFHFFDYHQTAQNAFAKINQFLIDLESHNSI